jgi:hypothetical protein
MKTWILLAGLAVAPLASAMGAATSAVAAWSVVGSAAQSHVPANPPAPVCQLTSDSATLAAADGCPYTGGGY